MTRGFTCMIHVCVHVVHTTCMYVHMYVQYYMTYLVANSMQKRFQLVIHDDFVKTITTITNK